METKSNENEIRKGLLVLAVLQVIDRQKVYAGELLTELSRTEFATQEGTLYPLLSRLKREGLIRHEWVESPSGPPRKYYSLSEAGKQRTTELLSYLHTLQKELKNLGGHHE